MNNLFKNWKTTSAGIIAIIGGVCVFVFNHPITQPLVMMGATPILTGLGLIFAGDASQSIQTGDTVQTTDHQPVSGGTQATITKQ